MPVFVCMLRAVNLGSHNKIKMEALRSLCASLKFQDARTYLQSGNVVFRTAEKRPAAVCSCLESAIEKTFGFRTPIILRTSSDLRTVIARNPFASRRNIDPSKLLVVFLASEPAAEACAAVRKIDTAPEELFIHGRELFIYFPNGMARPKISWPRIEKALNVPGTGRNWNTVTNLLALAESLES